MVTQHSYLAYKRDTRQLLYWMTHTSNLIIKKLRASDNDASFPPLNTSGQMTVAELASAAKLIGKHKDLSPIPSKVFRLLTSIISARSRCHEEFQRLVAARPDAQVKESNSSHKFFIDTLTQALKALGGDNWDSTKDAEVTESEEDVENIVFSNKFSALNVETPPGGYTSDEACEDDAQVVTKTPSHAQKKPSKGKKKKVKKQQKPSPSSESVLDDVPLTTYRIIEDEEGIRAEYLLAVFSIAHEWTTLRNYLQDVWYEVVYQGLNSAIAGAICNVAIGMVKQTASDSFIDFPGRDHFSVLIRTMDPGYFEDSPRNVPFTLYKMILEPGETAQRQGDKLDFQEVLMGPAFYNLLDFILDYQKTRSGKPTQKMLRTIKNWDPKMDLSKATCDQRVEWRRSYTIRWLYDLVNLYSAPVTRRIRVEGEYHVLENIDWSPTGPCGHHRRLFGIGDFAAFVTELAMQKSNTNMLQRIHPHHVFQLQCIVDSFTVSRGWRFNSFESHVLKPPPEGKVFHPRRDINMFLDRNNERPFAGFLKSVKKLQVIFEKGGLLKEDPEQRKIADALLNGLQFSEFLGQSSYVYDPPGDLPSRFSDSNPNGLWDFSPFLCAVGLADGLDLAYRASMFLLDVIPEPTLLIHLHNMLLKKGYLTEMVTLYAALQKTLLNGVFVGGKVPDSGFALALIVWVLEHGPSAPSATRDLRSHSSAVLNVDLNRAFRYKPSLAAYRDADWNLDLIPDHELHPCTRLGTIRLGQTKCILDPATGKKRVADTDLVRRFRGNGMTDERILDICAAFARREAMRKADTLAARKLFALLPEVRNKHHLLLPEPEFNTSRPGPRLSRDQMLTEARLDLYEDLCDLGQLLGVDYVWLILKCYSLFDEIEKELSRRRNPLYVRVYESAGQWIGNKRVGLVALAMCEGDKECLRVMAEQFNRNRHFCFVHSVYWDKLRPVKDLEDRALDNIGGGSETGCTFM